VVFLKTSAIFSSLDARIHCGRRLHRKVSRFLALEDAIDVTSRAPVLINLIRTVGDQTAGNSEEAFEVERGQFMGGTQA
jgi:hypothetical protein